ncbi:MAG TPA: DUF4339 domain-containing protein [Opitutaceae bacterium]|nr:DUF4339 domain-containing protein [Opitutaceae bacterium]
MKYYYANAQNQPTGPVEVEELQRLLATGTITLSTNVVAEGSQHWAPLSTVLPGVSAGPAPASAAQLNSTAALQAMEGVAQLPTLLADGVDRLLERVRRRLGSDVLQRSMALFAGMGQILIVIGAALGLLFAVIYAIKFNSFMLFLAGVLGVLAIAVLQYVAKRFLEGCARLVRSSPSRVASAAVLDCLGLILLIAALGILIAGVVGAIRLEAAVLLVPAVVNAATWFFLALVALHPATANVTVEDASAGEEAIGLLSFFFKSSLVMLPLGFFLCSLSGALTLAIGLFGGNAPRVLPFLSLVPGELLGSFAGSIPSEAVFSGIMGLSTLVLALLLPLITYLLFLFAYLLVDIIRAIVSIPAKLDALRR